MKKANPHVVFQAWQMTYNDSSPRETTKVVTVGVWIDLDQLAEMAVTAAKSKGRKCKDGALNVKVHTVREVAL